MFFIQNLLSCCGDIEENPGPKYSPLTFCHWNLNGLTAHDSTKILLFQAYITQHNYDIICLTETFLNSSILSDDNRTKIEGYNLIRSDHPSDSKKGGVCIYYKEHIPLILQDDINTLDNCLVTEIRSQNEKNFCTNFDILLNNINDELPLCSRVTGFCKKANIFNNFFASICTPIDNTSCLPSFSYRTGSRIKSFHVTENDILAIIKTLDPNKANGCNNIMIKICSQSLTLPLKIIFEHSLKKGKFPEIMKKANVVPAHKREDKMLVKNYRPISLLPIFGKMFERVTYNSLFNYFQSNRLFTPSQSGFLPGDSCIAQLLSIIHEIQTAFDENPTVDVRGVFLDLSKGFDKVWHDGIIFKLKAYGVEGKLLSLLKNYLENREQRVVLNGQTSEWRKIMSGIPQGSVLGPLLFLIYINDLLDGISSLCKIFADDTSLFSKVYDIHKSASNLNDDLEKISYWAYQ